MRQVALDHEPHLRRQLVVETPAAQLPRHLPVQLDIEARVGRIPDARARLTLVFVEAEVVQPVENDRAAGGPGILLIRDRHSAADRAVLGIESVVAEVGSKRTG